MKHSITSTYLTGIDFKGTYYRGLESFISSVVKHLLSYKPKIDRRRTKAVRYAHCSASSLNHMIICQWENADCGFITSNAVKTILWFCQDVIRITHSFIPPWRDCPRPSQCDAQAVVIYNDENQSWVLDTINFQFICISCFTLCKEINIENVGIQAIGICIIRIYSIFVEFIIWSFCWHCVQGFTSTQR